MPAPLPDEDDGENRAFRVFSAWGRCVCVLVRSDMRYTVAASRAAEDASANVELSSA